MRARSSGWLAVLVWLLTAAEPTPVEHAWTGQDVVRQHVAGVSPRALIAEIASRQVRFTLTPEMLDELRQAGLPDDVIAAMRARQAESGREPGAIESAPFNLRVVFGSGRGLLRVGDEIDPQLAAELELHGPPEEREVADLAVFLACRTGAHVPDGWKAVSPLGRDDISMPRHQMLAFVPGARRVGKHLLELDLARPLEARVDPDSPHDLILGVAAEIAGRYYRIASDTWEGAVLGPQGLELRATVRKGQGLGSLGVSFEKPGGSKKGARRPAACPPAH